VEQEAYIPSVINLVSESPFGIGAAKFRQFGYEGFVDSVWPGVFWRKIFDEVGLYREEFIRTEDIEFNRRLRDRGYKIYMTPKIKAFYYARDTLQGFLLQNFQNGYGVMQTLIFTNKITALRHFVPFVFVLSIIILLCLSFVSNFARILFLLELGFYMVANIYFSVKSSLKKGLKYFPILPLVFAVLHFSYGIGSVWAVLKYVSRRGW
jgi:GT2 family glycosyltransferase